MTNDQELKTPRHKIAFASSLVVTTTSVTMTAPRIIKLYFEQMADTKK